MLFVIFLLFSSPNSSVNKFFSIKEIKEEGLEISFNGEGLSKENLSFLGASYLGNPGEPNLPSLYWKIGIPQEGDVEIKILKNHEVTFSNVDIPPVIPLGIYEPPYPEKREIYGEVYKKNQLYPEEIIEVSRRGYFRDIYTLDLRINPVRYNPVKRELVISKTLQIKINFRGNPFSMDITDNSYESIYEHLIVNYNQCKYWRRPKIREDIKNPFETGVWFKIEIDTEGLYRIGYDEIKKAGLDPKQFDPRTLRIYTAPFELLPRNVWSNFPDSLFEVPVYVEGEDDGSFDKDDYLLFYGFAASHLYLDRTVKYYENGYARGNVYWFTFGGRRGKRMEKLNGAWNGSPPDTFVTEVLHLEEDLYNPSRSGTNWFWLDVSPGEGNIGSASFTIRHPFAKGNADVAVALFNLEPAGEFRYQFSFSGVMFFDSLLSLPIAPEWPPNYLYGSGNLNGDSSTFSLEIKRTSGNINKLTAYFNSLNIIYKRKADLKEPFHGYFPSPKEYSLKCFNANSKVFILDISDIRNPRMFDNLNEEGDNVLLSLKCDSILFLYFSQLNSAKTAHLIPRNPGRLRIAESGCEYLFITHRNFYNSLYPLVEYRRREYTTTVVNVDEIFDDFSYGKYDPLAIKHFLFFAYKNWTTCPKFVLFVGDATYDYKNNLKKENPPNFVPMYELGTYLADNPGIPMHNTIYEGEYADFGGGEAMVLGRITVRNNQELRSFIDKLIAYETKDIDGIWNKRIFLSGDDEYSSQGWEGFMHTTPCENIYSIIPNSLYDVSKLYLLSYPPLPPPVHRKPNAQNDFIKELNKGFLAGCFFGHGNTHQLAHEGLFFDTNIPQINNGSRFFFFFFGSCTVGRFDDSDYECIGEELVRIKGGAIGTMGATGGTGNNQPIGLKLFTLITDPDTNLTMGECVLISKKEGGHLNYLCLGDPATRLRKVKYTTEISETPDSLRPLEKLKVISEMSPYYLSCYVRDTTHIDTIGPGNENKIHSHIYRIVQTGPNSWTPYDYRVLGKEVYQGYWDKDTSQVIVPFITTTHLPVISASIYKNQSSGFKDSIRVYGSAIPSTDNTGPEIKLYNGARELKEDDWVDKDFTLTGVVSDESGINLLNTKDDSRGFFLYMGRDNGINRIDLRPYFIYHKNSFTTGEFNISLSLEQKRDSITVYVSDNRFNQTIKSITLNTEMYDRIVLENLLVYPNPIRDKGDVFFTFYLTRSGVVQIKIFTIAGRLIKTLPERFCNVGYNQIPWNGLDEMEDELANGVYLVQVSAEVGNKSDKEIEKFIIAR